MAHLQFSKLHWGPFLLSPGVQMNSALCSHYRIAILHSSFLPCKSRKNQIKTYVCILRLLFLKVALRNPTLHAKVTPSDLWKEGKGHWHTAEVPNCKTLDLEICIETLSLQRTSFPPVSPGTRQLRPKELLTAPSHTENPYLYLDLFQ